MREKHLNDNEFIMFADGSLSGEELEAVKSHLSSCALCRDELSFISYASVSFMDIKPDLPPGDFLLADELADAEAAFMRASAKEAMPLYLKNEIRKYIPKGKKDIFSSLWSLIYTKPAFAFAGAIFMFIFGLGIIISLFTCKTAGDWEALQPLNHSREYNCRINPGTAEKRNPRSAEKRNPGTAEKRNPGTAEKRNPGTAEKRNPRSAEKRNPEPAERIKHTSGTEPLSAESSFSAVTPAPKLSSCKSITGMGKSSGKNGTDIKQVYSIEKALDSVSEVKKADSFPHERMELNTSVDKPPFQERWGVGVQQERRSEGQEFTHRVGVKIHPKSLKIRDKSFKAEVQDYLDKKYGKNKVSVTEGLDGQFIFQISGEIDLSSLRSDISDKFGIRQSEIIFELRE